MKKNLLILSLAGMATVLSAESKSFDGYSYGGVGFENITYQEDGNTNTYGHIKSKAKGSSPVYMTGNLVRVNDKYDFSLDFSSTLLASDLSETWTRNGAALQNTNMDVTINSMRLLGHYKLDDKNRIVFGPSYSLNSFKRFNFKDTNPTDTYIKDGVVTPLNVDDTDGLLTEERVATLFATFGYWYESAPVATPNTFRFKLNTLYSQPLWNSASNTGFEGVSFSSLSGYKMDINGYVGYPVMKGLEVGMFVGYQYQRKMGDDKSQGIVWPDNTLQIIQGGLLASWNFSRI